MSLRRSSSTQLRGLANVSDLKEGPSRTRSISAERGAWVTHGPPRPRDKERFVPLPIAAGDHHLLLREEDEEQLLISERSLDGSTPEARGRITIITVCESFDLDDVVKAVNAALPGCTCGKYPEVVAVQTACIYEAGRQGDAFIFDYGVVILWGLDVAQELNILRMIRACEVLPLPAREVQQEELAFHYSQQQQPHIQNDCITISWLEASNVTVKMAISHALAQSCKLNLYEARVWELVEKVRALPEELAEHGEIQMSRQQMAQITGQVFIQKSEVNLLSTVLDTPDFFWTAPDALRHMYDKVSEYLELSDRVALVNSRIMLIQSMLSIWSDHAAHRHLARLDKIVVVLIVVEVILAAAEVVGYFFHRSI